MALMQKVAQSFPLSRQNLPTVLLVIIFSIAIFTLLHLYASVTTDDGQWERFKADHHCRLLVNERGSQRLSWQCDDGKLYYRWRQQR